VSSTERTKSVYLYTCFCHGRYTSSQRDTTVQFLASSFFRHGTFCGPWASAVHLPLWPPSPTSTPHDQNLPSTTAATWSKETSPSVRLSVCCACPHRTRFGRDSSGSTATPTTEWLPLVPCPVFYLEAELAGPSRSVVGVLRILPQLLLCSPAVWLLLRTGQPHASRAEF
jgi:hypothetical protein